MNYHLSWQKAEQQYAMAKHLLTVTYPIIHDPKLLLGVVGNLSQALESGMEALLQYEQELKLLQIPATFQAKVNLFRSKSIPRNKLPLAAATLLLELHEIMKLHQKSPLEFPRQQRLIICNDRYNLKTVSAKELAAQLLIVKDFLGTLRSVLDKHKGKA